MGKKEEAKQEIERFPVTIKRGTRIYQTEVSATMWLPGSNDEAPPEIEGAFVGMKTLTTKQGTAPWVLLNAESRYWLIPNSAVVADRMGKLNPTPGTWLLFIYHGKGRTKDGQPYNDITVAKCAAVEEPVPGGNTEVPF